MQSNKRKGFLKSLAMLGLGLGLGLGMSASHAAGEKFVLISHAPDSDSWWNTIKNSVKQAGEDFNVTVDYRNPPNGDLADMARLVEQSAARNYDGVIVSIADFSVLQNRWASWPPRRFRLSPSTPAPWRKASSWAP